MWVALCAVGGRGQVGVCGKDCLCAGCGVSVRGMGAQNKRTFGGLLDVAVRWPCT